MQKINGLFHKRVIDQRSGDAVATVSDVVLSNDARRVVALVVSGGDRSSEELIIRWDAVVSVGEYVIVDGSKPWARVHEDLEVSELRQQAEQITGKPVVSTTGERLGTVNDMFYNSRGELVGFELKQGLFGGTGDNPILRAGHIQAIGKDALIADSTELVSLHDLDAPLDAPSERMSGTPYAGMVGIYDAPHYSTADQQYSQAVNMPPAQQERGVGEAPGTMGGASVNPSAPLYSQPMNMPPAQQERGVGEAPGTMGGASVNPSAPFVDERRNNM